MQVLHLFVFGSMMLILAYLAFRNGPAVAQITTATFGAAGTFAKTLQGR